MMISERTKLSLAQYLCLQDSDTLDILLAKHGLEYHVANLNGLVSVVRMASPDQLSSMLDEVLRTRGDLRTNVSPRYVYDERWDDLVHCLLLDGYRFKDRRFIPVDPTIEGAEPLDDDLTIALSESDIE